LQTLGDFSAISDKGRLHLPNGVPPVSDSASFLWRHVNQLAKDAEALFNVSVEQFERSSRSFSTGRRRHAASFSFALLGFRSAFACCTFCTAAFICSSPSR
jgi:hypothetical protein